jgi:hypothetical protein
MAPRALEKMSQTSPIHHLLSFLSIEWVSSGTHSGLRTAQGRAWILFMDKWPKQDTKGHQNPGKDPLHPQKNVNTFTIQCSPRTPKPPKPPISSVYSPTPSIRAICRYDVATSTTSGTFFWIFWIFWILVVEFGIVFVCNFWFCWWDTLRMLNNLEYMNGWLKLHWQMPLWVWFELRWFELPRIRMQMWSWIKWMLRLWM